MKVYLLKNSALKFNFQRNIPPPQDLVEYVSSPNVRFQLMLGDVNPSEDAKNFIQETAKKIVRSYIETSESQVDRLQAVWNMNVVIQISSDGAVVSVNMNGPLLELLHHHCAGMKGMVRMYVKTFSVPTNNTAPSTCIKWRTMDAHFDWWKESGFQPLFFQRYAGHTFPPCVKVTWPVAAQPGGSFECLMTIQIELDDGTAELNAENRDSLTLINRQMLKDDVTTDAIIVAENGVEIPCHRSFLSAHSAVLKAMLQSGFKEGQTRKIEMSDLPEEAVRAFLAFLYYFDITAAENDCSIAFDLLTAGDKYDIALLTKNITDLFLARGEKWYTIDTAMDVYLLARNLDSLQNLKLKAASMLKAKNEELKISEKFHKLFMEYPVAAKELYLLK